MIYIFAKCQYIFFTGCDVMYNIGFCKQSLLKWGYNKTAGKCETFLYAGCGGNANNFDNKEDCDSSCVDQLPWLPLFFLTPIWFLRLFD